MDPISLASAAVALLAPFARKGAEAIATELGKKTTSAAAALLKALSARWADKVEPKAALQSYLQDPAATDRLVAALSTEIKTDGVFKTELQRLIQGNRPEVFVKQVVTDTDDVLGAKVREMTRGLLSVDQSVTGAKSATAVEIDKLGS